MDVLQSVPCWSIPPSQCIRSTYVCRPPIQGAPACRLGRRGVPLAVSQLAAAADSPPGYLSRARKPRGTALLNPSDDPVSLQQLLLVPQLQQEEGQQQQQQAERSQNGFQQHAEHAEALPDCLQDKLQQMHPQEFDLAAQIQQHLQQQEQRWARHDHDSMQQPLQTEGQLQEQKQQRHTQQQAQLQQVQCHPQQQLLAHKQHPLAQQQPHQLQQQLLHQQGQLQSNARQQQQYVQQQQHIGQSVQQQQQVQQQANQGNGRSRQVQQQQHTQVGPGYIRGPREPQQQQQQQQHWQQHGPAVLLSSGQQGLPICHTASPLPDTGSGSSSNSSSSSSRHRRASAYTVVPTSTAPAVSQASAAAAASAAAVAAAARSRAKQLRRSSSSTAAHDAAAAAAGDSEAATVLPPAEECVPRAFWGLMNEELRPWHKQVLVHLCYLLPAPACHIYRDMTAGRMQKVLAQRAMLEKDLRGHLVELVHQQQQIRSWLNLLQARQPRVDRTLNPDNVLETQQQLLNLKAGMGRSRYTLHTLQDRAAAYSDRDYVQYSQSFAAMLSEMEGLADLQREHAAPLVLQLQQLQDSAAWRVLFARTEDAVAALNREAAARAQHMVQSEQAGLDSMKQRLDRLKRYMQQYDWRYPPAPYIAWRFKGTPRGFRNPWTRTPGVQSRQPKARQNIEQLQQQGAPPRLLGS